MCVDCLEIEKCIAESILNKAEHTCQHIPNEFVHVERHGEMNTRQIAKFQKVIFTARS